MTKKKVMNKSSYPLLPNPKVTAKAIGKPSEAPNNPIGETRLNDSVSFDHFCRAHQPSISRVEAADGPNIICIIGIMYIFIPISCIYFKPCISMWPLVRIFFSPAVSWTKIQPPLHKIVKIMSLEGANSLHLQENKRPKGQIMRPIAVNYHPQPVQSHLHHSNQIWPTKLGERCSLVSAWSQDMSLFKFDQHYNNDTNDKNQNNNNDQPRGVFFLRSGPDSNFYERSKSVQKQVRAHLHTLNL